MRIGLRILYVLIFLRLMAPPGVCLCKLSAPALAFLAGNSLPQEDQTQDDDHLPGCPCSPLCAGMGLQPPVEMVPLPQSSLDVVPQPPLLETFAKTWDLTFLPLESANPTLFESSCLLLI